MKSKTKSKLKLQLKPTATTTTTTAPVKEQHLHPSALTVLRVDEHLPPMTVRIQHDSSRYSFQPTSADIYADPKDIIKKIDEQFKRHQQLKLKNGDVCDNEILHMFRKVDGASIGAAIFNTAYDLPDGKGQAFAYMSHGIRQRPIDVDEDAAKSAMPSHLVKRNQPTSPMPLSLTDLFPSRLSLPKRTTPAAPTHTLLLPTPAEKAPGCLRDPSLNLFAEMWPALELGTDGKPPSLDCGTCCGKKILQTVLVRKNPNGKSKYYHPHCVCYDCDLPLMKKLRVPYANDSQFYHPDCTCKNRKTIQ